MAKNGDRMAKKWQQNGQKIETIAKKRRNKKEIKTRKRFDKMVIKMATKWRNGDKMAIKWR